MGIIKKAITALFLGFVLLLLFSALGPAFFGVLFLFLLFWLIWRFRSQWHLKPAHRNILIVLFLIVVGFAVWVVLFSMSPGITMLLTFLVLAFGVITWGVLKKGWRIIPTQQQSNFITPTRPTIPSAVKQYVWQRDGGRCVQCGSNERLEYDHIIPVSKGDGNTERNLQLLCEHCNRKKHAKIM